MTTQADIQVIGTTLGVPSELDIRVGGGPVSIRLAPKQGINFTAVWNEVSNQLRNALGFGLPDLNGPWAKALLGLDDDKNPLIATPTLWISPSGGATNKLALSLQLEFSQILTIGGSWTWNGITIEMTPTYRIEALIFAYDSAAGGLSIKAKVVNPTTTVPTSPNQLALVGTGAPAGEKAQLLTFPFPVPAQQPAAGKLFEFHYIGIGQRVGPNPNVSSDDPMLAIFEQLESQLTGDDPAEVLTTLANNFYHPDRGWFIGLDVELRGFRVMLLFNDPAMYGLRISVGWTPPTPFSGFLFEILYQKLSPNLGVYYGALTLPYFMRRIVIQGVILILPGFAIWIYTNGDFRINVGWPLGDNSIAIQVGPLIGAAGFYFAKLRSADNPGVQPTVDYNPILAFGIGIMVYIKQGFNASIFSAQINVSLSVTMQGLLAWKAGEGSFVTKLPDHYWFAGTASLSVLIEGSVDFSIIKASVTISFQAFAGLALETGYGTVVDVSAQVSVRVSVKVIFFTIHLSFSTGISKQFAITGGPPASVDGPLDPDLQGFIHPTLEELRREQIEAHVRTTIARLTPKPTAASRRQTVALGVFSPQIIDVQFALQPTAIYASGGSGAFSVIASLFIEAPAPGNSAPVLSTPFEQLIIAIVDWLLSQTLPGPLLSARFEEIASKLGSGSDAPMGDWVTWRTGLDAFLGTLTFNISEVDTTSNAEQPAAVLPMLDVLRLTYVDANGVTQEIDFDTYNPVPENYPTLVNQYYQYVGWVGQNPVSQVDARKLRAANVRESFAAYILSDYFLMQARNAANALWTAALAYEKAQNEALLADTMRMFGDAERVFELMERITDHVAQVTGGDELAAILATFDYVSAAGLGSRYILNGLQLPLPPPGSPAETAPMHVLTGQQYGVAQGAASVSGTLSISPTSGAPAGSIVFNSGSPGSATCTLTLPPLPEMPSAEWQGATGSPYDPVNGTIALAPLPGVTPSPLYYSTKNQVAWDAAGMPRTILPLPQPLQSLVTTAKPPVQLTVLTTPPPTSNDPALASPQGPPLPATAALLIRLSISQVPSNSAISVTSASPAGGSPATAGATQFLPFVYAVSGADEATRDLIFNALQGDLSNASISLLYTTTGNSSPSARSPVASPAGATGLQSEELSESVLLAKTNLSTLNQVPGAGAMQAERFAVAVTLGNDAAQITDVQGFLRLLWEVSVVNAPGFFLYYITAGGEDLPPLFSQPGTPGGNPAQFDVLVEFARSPAAVVPLTAATNCVILDEPALVNAVYLEVLQQSGAPVLQYAPTYAAGNIGFSLLWHRPAVSTLPVPVNELYTLVQYQIAGGDGYTESVWSLPVGPSDHNGPNAALTSPSHWSYVTTVAVSMFHGSPAGNRYSIIDQEVDLGFRIVDLYGDALPGAVEASFLPLYQDPLFTVAQWPGVIWSWAVVAGTGKTATLVLTVTFDPASVIPPSSSPSSPESPPEPAAEQWLGILGRYGLILDQLTDPNTTLSLTSSLTSGPMIDRATTTGHLVGIAGAIATNIQNALASSPVDVEGLVQTIDVPIPFSAIAALNDDIIEVSFTIGAARDASLVDPTAVTGLPAAVAVSYGIPPALSTTASPSGSPALAFSIDFEAAFRDFDGAGGMLKLAQRAGVQNGDDAPAVEAFWVVRWSAAAGLSIELDPDPVFFALAPLSNAPISGTFGGRTWTDIDVDVWARQFLAAYDNFLAPQFAVAIAVLDVANGTNWFDQLADTKEGLAKAIVNGVQNVFVDQEDEGSRSAAQARLQQALLSTLGNAFTVSTIVQIPATVTMNATPSPITSPARAPRLYGSVGPISTDSPLDTRQYTLTPGELELIPGQNWITTLLTVTNGSNISSITMPLDYQVSYLQHDFEVEDAYLDYIPSSWLKFTLPQGEPLQIPTVESILPVPLIFVPQSPSLIGQAAGASPLASGGNAGNITNEITDALQWTYDVEIAPNWLAQDALYFDITYNLTPSEVTIREAGAAAYAANLAVLADALATFLLWYEANAGAFGEILREAFPNMPGSPAGSPGSAQALVAGFAKNAAAVQSAWAALFDQFEKFLVPEVTVDSFYIDMDTDASGKMQLYGRAQDGSNPLYWPSVNGQPYDRKNALPPASEKGWWQQPEPFTSKPLLALAIPDIAIADRQSATTSAWIIRNAHLVDGRTTNPDFVYETAPVAFSTAVVPLIYRASLATLQPLPAGLIETLAAILAPIANTGAGLSTHLRVAASYSFALATTTGQALPALESVLLADALEIGGSPVHVTEVATMLAGGISAWYLAAPRPKTSALLNIALTLFGTLGSQQLPLVQIDRIPIDVSAVNSQWWST